MTVAVSTSIIRQWARAQGLSVGDRGRLSPQLLEAYAASHGQPRQVARKATTAATHAPDAGVRISVRPVPGATGSTRTISARAV